MAIYYPEKLGQLKDFGQLKLNGFTPTDIDFIYDQRGKKWIIGEVKTTGAKIPNGQLRCILGLASQLAAAGCEAIVLLAEHNTPTDEPIDVGALSVTQTWYYNKKYSKQGLFCGLTVKEACDLFLGGDVNEESS